MISKWWYALTAVPAVIGIAIAVWLALGLLDDVEGMPRLVIPGERELTLEAREYVVYGETQSVVDGQAYAFTSFSARCRMVDAATDEPLALESTTGSTKYSFGSYEGRSMFEVDVPKAGVYRLGCEGDPGVLAIGTGIGMSIVGMLAAGFAGMGLGVVVFFLVRRRRKRGA